VHRKNTLDHADKKVEGRVCWIFSKCDPPAPVMTEANDEVKYMGCYKDEDPQNGFRDLPVRKGSGDNAYCAKACEGYRYFARQWTNECRCGDMYGKYGEAEECGDNCEDKPDANIGLFKNCVYQNTIEYATAKVTKVVQLKAVQASKPEEGGIVEGGNNQRTSRRPHGSPHTGMGGKQGKGKKWWKNGGDGIQWVTKMKNDKLSERLARACDLESYQICGAKPGIKMAPKKLLRCLKFHDKELSEACSQTVELMAKRENIQIKPGLVEAGAALHGHHGKPMWQKWQFWVGVALIGSVLGGCAGVAFTIVLRFTNERHLAGNQPGSPQMPGAHSILPMFEDGADATGTMTAAEMAELGSKFEEKTPGEKPAAAESSPL